jgi:hypothetical protein
MSAGFYDIAPCSRLAGDDEPGVRLTWTTGALSRLSPSDARGLGADLILAANASEAQWDAPGPRVRTEPQES